MSMLSCPFCGSTKVKIQTNKTNYIIKASGRCNSCHARGPLFTTNFHTSDDKQIIAKALANKAFDAWNKRS